MSRLLIVAIDKIDRIDRIFVNDDKDTNLIEKLTTDTELSGIVHVYPSGKP